MFCEKEVIAKSLIFVSEFVRQNMFSQKTLFLGSKTENLSQVLFVLGYVLDR